MPGYAIQFRKGLSMRVFLKRYGTKSQCVDALCQSRWPHGFACSEFGSGGHCRLSRGLYQCLDCHH